MNGTGYPMQIISLEKLNNFAQRHPNSKPGLHRWRDLVRQNSFWSLNQVREVFPHADLAKRVNFVYSAPQNRGVKEEVNYTVFNIGGNKTRLIAKIQYELQLVRIHLVLTHAEYNAWLKRR